MALLTKLRFEGRVERVLARGDRGTGLVKNEVEALTMTFAGPDGDCHAGLTRKSDSRTTALYKRGIDIRNVRQVTLVSVEELTEVAGRLGIAEVQPGWFGGNILVSGIPDLTLLPPSTRLQFQSGATLVADMENLPCSQIADIVEQHHPGTGRMVVKQAMHKRGITAWVEREGLISKGDVIAVFIPPQRVYAHSG